MRCVGIGRDQILPNSCSAIDAACWLPSSLSTTLAFTGLLTHDPWRGLRASGARSRLRRNCWPLAKRSHDGCKCGFRMLSWSRPVPDHSYKADGFIATQLPRQASQGTFQWATYSGSSVSLPSSSVLFSSSAPRKCSKAMTCLIPQLKGQYGAPSQQLCSRQRGFFDPVEANTANSAKTHRKCSRSIAVVIPDISSMRTLQVPNT